MKRKPDRRTQRTRAALMSAFAELMLARGYAEVTIADVIRKAHIGRSTFYLHYSSKEALLEDCLKGPSRGLAECVNGAVTLQRMTALLDHFKEQRDVNRVFFGYSIRAVWVKSLASLIEPRLPRGEHRRDVTPLVPRSLTALMVAEMQIALISHWLTGKVWVKSEVVAAALLASTHALILGSALPHS
jgi:AcrR family transcriptional regulator